MTSDRDRDGALEQASHLKINGVKARLNRPLHFEKVGSGGSVESTLVSRFQISAFFSVGKSQVRRVAKFSNGIAYAPQVLRMNQQIDVPGLPQRDVSVDHFRQGQPLVGHDLHAERRQVANDSNQLTRKK